jgi:FeS assembly SUF system protein
MSNETLDKVLAETVDPAAADLAPPPARDAGSSNGAAVSVATGALSSEETARLTDEIVTAIKTVYDPEIPADVYELGLIYRIDIADDRTVAVDMTLTTPNCPSAQELPNMVENAVASVPGVGPVTVKVVWEPAWEPSRMSDEARVVLNMW